MGYYKFFRLFCNCLVLKLSLKTLNFISNIFFQRKNHFQYNPSIDGLSMVAVGDFQAIVGDLIDEEINQNTYRG